MIPLHHQSSSLVSSILHQSLHCSSCDRMCKPPIHPQFSGNKQHFWTHCGWNRKEILEFNSYSDSQVRIGQSRGTFSINWLILFQFSVSFLAVCWRAEEVRILCQMLLYGFRLSYSLQDSTLCSCVLVRVTVNWILGQYLLNPLYFERRAIEVCE